MKYCEYCGRELQEGQKFCASCGAPTQETRQGGAETQQPGGAYQQTQQQTYGQQSYGQQQPYGQYQQQPYDQHQQPYGYAYPGQDTRKTSGFAIAALVCSLVGLLFFGIILEPLAIIFGAVGLNQCNKQPGQFKGKGLAIAGLVLGIILLLLFILFLAMGGLRWSINFTF